VYHLLSSERGRQKNVILQSWHREQNGYQYKPNKENGYPVMIQLRKGCSCPILDQSKQSYVLLKERKGSGKINSIDLDENAVVLEKSASLSKAPLDVLLGQCGNGKIDAKRHRL